MKLCDLNKLKAEDVSTRHPQKLAGSEGVAVAMLEVSRGEETHARSHEHEEVILVLKGAWRFRLRGEEVTVLPNQMLSIPPGVEHSSLALEDTLAVDICSPLRQDRLTGEDSTPHYDPDQYLWGV